MIFKSKYKEDAIKWREYEEKIHQDKLAETLEVQVIFKMSDGSTKKLGKIFKASEQFLYFGGGSCVLPPRSHLNMWFGKLKNEVGVTGVDIGGTFYLPHMINSVEVVEITND